MSHGSFDHLASSRKHWALVIAGASLTLVCGSIGVWQYEAHYGGQEQGGLPRILGAIYTALQMLILHTPHFEHGTNLWLEVGRWCGVLTLGTATGMLLWIRARRELRWLWHQNASGHLVVCGLGEKGVGIVKCLRKKHPDSQVFAIDLSPDPAHLDECDTLGVCVISGDATQSKVLAEARVTQAKEIIIITPSDEINVRVALEVLKICAMHGAAIPRCHVQVADINLREILQTQDIVGSANAVDGGVLHFFDVFDREARQILLDLPIDGAGITANDARRVHLVILGFGRMGRSVALRAARLGHFANGRALRITVVDREAKRQRGRLFFRHPSLESTKICELQFEPFEAESLATRQLLEKFAAEPDTLLHVFVCVDANTRATEMALRIREILARWPQANVMVRIKSHASLASILELDPEVRPDTKPGDSQKDRSATRAFGMVEDASTDGCYFRDSDDALARSSHELFLNQFLPGSRRLAEHDDALLPWENLREEYRESNRQQVDHIAIKLRAIRCEVVPKEALGDPVTSFGVQEIETLAKMEHNRWNTERWLAGWRYGTPTDDKQRINANLVPWDALDDSIREYDREIVRRIPSLLGQTQPSRKVIRGKSR